MDVAVYETLGLRSSNGAEVKPAKLSKRGRQTRAGRNRLLDRESLDGRTIVAKVFDQLVAAIHADLGGRDQLTAIELALVEAFAGSSVALNHLNTRILTGAEIDNTMIAMHAQAISAMVRVASRLGLQRRAKPVSSLTEYLASLPPQESVEPSAGEEAAP
jgi:hypothetical protein